MFIQYSTFVYIKIKLYIWFRFFIFPCFKVLRILQYNGVKYCQFQYKIIVYFEQAWFIEREGITWVVYQI